MSWQEGKWGRSYTGVSCKGGSQWGWQDYGEAEARVHNKLAEVWGFAESGRGRFDEVLGGWIRGEDVETLSKDQFESILSGPPPTHNFLLLRKATVIWPKYSFLFHLYMS